MIAASVTVCSDLSGDSTSSMAGASDLQSLCVVFTAPVQSLSTSLDVDVFPSEGCLPGNDVN